MKNSSQSTPSKNRLVIPGAPKEETGQQEASTESNASEQASASNGSESTSDGSGNDENVSGLKPLFAKGSGGQASQAEPGQSAQAEAAEQPASSDEPAQEEEPKSIRRLLPRGVVDDDTAPVHRHLSSYQTSSVSVATGQVSAAEPQNSGHAAPSQPAAAPSAGAGQAGNAAVSNAPRSVAPVKPKGVLSVWVFSMVGFLFGVVTIFMFAKLGLLPAQLGLTNQEAIQEAVEDERARIIKILKSDGYEDVVEDWDDFENIDD